MLPTEAERPRTRAARVLDNERGVALPLALLGLVAVSIVVTTALVTSSTEVALSAAHQDGLRSLYTAESGLEGFLAQRAAAGSLESEVYATTANGVELTVAAAELARRPTASIGAQVVRRATFSLLASPESARGRSVGALVDAVQSVTPFGLNITSGAMIGTEEIKLPGQSYMITGQDTSSCAQGNAPGMVVASDVNTDEINKPESVIGGIERSEVTKADFARFILGDRSPEEAAAAAEIKWGDLEGGRPLSTNQLESDPLKSRDSWLNWGCPIGLGSTCATDPDNEYYPVVAVKGSADGATHFTGVGQGVLIILGDAVLNAGFSFKGVVVVTGDLRVNGGTKIAGSLVALSDITLQDQADADSTEDETTINGQGEIRFDRCAVEEAQNAINENLLDAAPKTFPDASYGWFEVIR